MRALSYWQQLVRLVHRLLLWLGLDTRRALFDFLATWFIVLLTMEIGHPHPDRGRALLFLFFYIYCSRRAK